MQEKYGLLKELLTESEKNYESIAPFELIIKRDISRTFPKHMLFREKLGWGFVFFIFFK